MAEAESASAEREGEELRARYERAVAASRMAGAEGDDLDWEAIVDGSEDDNVVGTEEKEVEDDDIVDGLCADCRLKARLNLAPEARVEWEARLSLDPAARAEWEALVEQERATACTARKVLEQGRVM